MQAQSRDEFVDTLYEMLLNRTISFERLGHMYEYILANLNYTTTPLRERVFMKAKEFISKVPMRHPTYKILERAINTLYDLSIAPEGSELLHPPKQKPPVYNLRSRQVPRK